MQDFQNRLLRQSAHSFLHTIKSVLLIVGLVCTLFGLCAWLFGPGAAYLLCALLAAIILLLPTCILRSVTPNPENNSTLPAPIAFFERAHSSHMSKNTDMDKRIAALRGKRWGLDVFAAIDAQRFAAVCETWFSWAGFETRSETHRTREGVDIWLHATRMSGPVAIVRCTHWLNKPVGLRDMKDFLDLVATCKSAHGTFTTTSTYTPEALQFAKENGIDAVDGRSLLRRIQTRTQHSQQALLAVAYHGLT